MRISSTLVILILAIAGCNKREKTAQASGVKNCELHHRPLKNVSGYAAGPGLMVDPGDGVTEFNTQFGNRYPHINRVALSSTLEDGWTEEMTVQVCEECEANYLRDFAAYIKTDYKERRDQFMDFLTKSRPRLRDESSPDSDAGASGIGTAPSVLPPP